MSKLLKLLFLTLLIGLIGAFVYLAFVDVPVAQDDVTKETTLDALKEDASKESTSQQ